MRNGRRYGLACAVMLLAGGYAEARYRRVCYLSICLAPAGTGKGHFSIKTASNLLPVPAAPESGEGGDSLAIWAERYFQFEVTTSARSQKEQRRDLALFFRFMEAAAGTLERSAWTPRLSRAFVEALRKEINADDSRHYSDRTINRVAAHLKTFAKWIQKLRPVPLGNPTEKLKGLALSGVLELERARPRFARAVADRLIQVVSVNAAFVAPETSTVRLPIPKTRPICR